MLPPMPEYAVIQQMHALPGAPLIPLGPDVATFMFPGGGPWDIGVDVSNGFSQGNQAGALYGLFFHDYTTWMNTGMPVGPFVGPLGAWIFKQTTPIAGAPSAFPLPTSMGAASPGPGMIDDSSKWGVCGSLAVDSAPTNQQGLTLQSPELVYVLDSEGDIEILEADFTTSAFAPYGFISTAFMGAGNMAADVEMIDTTKIAAANPKGYVPGKNLLAVGMVDGNPGANQGKWWVDIYIINKGNNTSALHASTPLNSGQPFLALDIDETTGDIYVLHGSNSIQGKTAITVYSYI